MTIGDALAAGRRQAGMSVTQVSQRTCIRETIIRSIERDDFAGCGGDFYARGHVRSIAMAVGVDPEPLIAEYDATIGAPRAISAADVFQPVTPVRLKERRKPNWTAALALALVVAGGVFAYVHFASRTTTAQSSNNSDVQTANAHHPQKKTVKPAKTAQPATHRLDITLTATQPCWVSLTTKTGQTLFQGMVYPGSTKHWSERRAVSLQLGNPAGVKVVVNGKSKIARGVTQPVTLALALDHGTRSRS
ncbi:MAG TPA: helix-turn-helix domain-containing protein [Streptosporangiaceae bacterium]|nr:helix-turn-helix domain-containing protein [Streptosporangiaceae bacterium]